MPSLDHSTPHTGLVVYTDPDGEQREIDVLMVLGARDELAMDQLRASIACARRLSALLLDDDRVRDVLALNERVFRKCLRDRSFRDLFVELAVDPFEAVLVDERLGRFVDLRYPQMAAQLAGRRAKDAAAFERRLALSQPSEPDGQTRPLR